MRDRERSLPVIEMQWGDSLSGAMSSDALAAVRQFDRGLESAEIDSTSYVAINHGAILTRWRSPPRTSILYSSGCSGDCCEIMTGWRRCVNTLLLLRNKWSPCVWMCVRMRTCAWGCMYVCMCAWMHISSELRFSSNRSLKEKKKCSFLLARSNKTLKSL